MVGRVAENAALTIKNGWKIGIIVCKSSCRDSNSHLRKQFWASFDKRPLSRRSALTESHVKEYVHIAHSMDVCVLAHLSRRLTR